MTPKTGVMGTACDWRKMDAASDMKNEGWSPSSENPIALDSIVPVGHCRPVPVYSPCVGLRLHVPPSRRFGFAKTA
jgi:hypothetical protein